MKKYLFVVLVVAIVANGSLSIAKDTITVPNSGFDNFKERFLSNLWKTYPTWASSVGYHKYDNLLNVPDAKNRESEIKFCESYLDSLSNIPYNELSAGNKIDYKLMENQLKYSLWSIRDLKAWQWDPSSYNVSGTFAEMLSNNYESLDKRLMNFYARMAFVPAYYEAAEQNISHPSSEHTQLAIDQNMGGISVFEKDLSDALKKSHLSQKQKNDIRARAKNTIAAIKDYAAWLQEYENETPRSFRLGKELYEKKFAFELQSGYTPEQIYNKALRRKEELHDDMYKLTLTLWPKYFPHTEIPKNRLNATRQMLDRLSKNHVHRDSFQAAIEKQLPVLTSFINTKGLLTLDASKPLVVRKEPEYMAGIAGASVSSPGPYDKNGNTYYNVGSLNGWKEDRAESYLREYNHYVLQILNIHEAIPGHYTQLVYANKSPDMIKSVLGNNAMIEGWAVYTERMMLENGYDGDHKINSKEAASPEMWLMYYKWHLRSVCNTILDYSVHVKNMSRVEAMNLLVNEAFQQKAEAEGKWKRVSVTQVQLCCYFTGYTEIYDLREKLMNRQGSKFDLKKFHEQFLSYGSVPVKFIKKMMVK